MTSAPARPGTIGIVSPGAMGSGLARAWRAAGVRTVATVAGRSSRTAALADGLDLLDDLNAVVSTSDLVVAVVPPDRALDVARSVALTASRTGTRPVYLDANAVSPTTVDSINDLLDAAGLDMTDGSISGGPPVPGGATTLYLSGPHAARWDLSGPGLAAVEVSPRLGDASAVKMCTASVYKGLSALLTQALGTADEHGVTPFVTADLHGSFPDSVDDAGRLIALAATKAHRFVGEMRQIAQTQGDAGMRPELFEAMAVVWQAVAATPLAQHSPEDVTHPELADVLRDLRAR